MKVIFLNNYKKENIFTKPVKATIKGSLPHLKGTNHESDISNNN
jgi:hypothetical protein